MESRILAPFMPSEVLSAALPCSSRPPIVQLMTQLLLMEWEKWASLAASCAVGEVEPSLTHSLTHVISFSPVGEITGQEDLS